MQHFVGDRDLADLPAEGLDIFVRVRSTRPPRPALLRTSADGAELLLSDAEDGVSPGQAAVFYETDGAGARVLGGGFVISAPAGQRDDVNESETV